MITVFLGLSAACDIRQETSPLHPIAFKADAGVLESTKAGGTLLKDFSVTSFNVYGLKSGASPATVFNGYQVNYDGGWKYSGINGQELQYWDSKADSYKFSATTGGDYSGGSVTFSGATKTGKNFVALESNNTVEPANFGEIVNLQFSRLLSRVRVAFYEDMEDWNVKDVRYSLSGTFVSQGDYSVDLSDGSFAVSNATSTPSIGRTIEGTIGGSKGEATYEDYSETLPFNNTAGITLTIHSYKYVDQDNGDEYEFSPELNVPIPAADARWDLNHSYTYIFRISESKVELDLSIALEIHDWEANENETILE